MDSRTLGIISALLYLVAGCTCLFGDAMGGTRFLQAGIGLYFVGRALQSGREFLAQTPVPPAQ